MACSPLTSACLRCVVLMALLAGATTCGPPSVWYGVSPDHRTTYEVSETDRRSCVRLGSLQQGCFDGISLHLIAFSRDSRHFAYPVQEDGAWFVILDGQAGPSVDGVGVLQFSPDGERLAYAALRNGSWHVVVDDRFGDPFDSLLEGSFRFDPTGRRLAFVAQRDGLAMAVIDARIEASHDGISAIQFSRGGRSAGYIARDGDRARLIVDGSVRGDHDAISEFRFSPSGRDVVYLFLDGGAWWVQDRDTVRGPFPAVRALSYANDGSGLTFVIRDGDRERVARGDDYGPWFGSVDAPVFDTLGERWGYIGQDSTHSVIFLNGAEASREEWATDLTLSDDGSRYAYVAQRGALTYVVHDRGERGFDVVVPGTLMFTAYQGRWACLAGNLDREELFVVVEGISEARPFKWLEVGQMITGGGGTVGPDPEESLRAWVSAEVDVLMSDER